MVLAGGSKTFKSWTMMDMGLSIASGTTWWDFECNQDTVVYINFELIDSFFEERILDICEAKKIKPPDNFAIWNLREVCYDLETVSRVLQERLASLGTRVGCIFVDPIYKALNGRDENAANEMTGLMWEIERLSTRTTSAVVFGAHFSKGSQAQKEAKDRISGSGVFGRDPDCILTMTRHMVKYSYCIETELRYLASPEDFVVTWEKPLMKRDYYKNAEDLWVPGKPVKEDDTIKLTNEQVLSVLVHSGMQDGMWKDQVKKKFGKAGNAFYERKRQLIEDGLVVRRGLKYHPANFELSGDAED
jgi:RecA-family ATPase